MFDYLLAIPAILFGIRTSFTDIKYGKIKNADVVIAIVIGALINIPKFRAVFFENVGIMFALVFGLYMIGLLSPGDAKLLIAYSAIVPMDFYRYGVSKVFPSIALLANIFVPATLVVILMSLKTVNMKMFFKMAKSRLSPKNMFNISISIFGLFYLIQYFLSLTGVHFGKFESMLIFILIFQAFNYFNIPTDKIAYAGSLIRIILQWKELLTPSFYINFFENILYFQLLNLTLVYFMNFSFSTPIKIDDLQPGMMPSQLLKKTKRGYIAEDFVIFNTRSLVRHSIKSVNGIHVLDKKTIGELKELRKKGKLKFKYIKISQTFPFGPFAFFGVLLTLLIHGSISFYLITVKDYAKAYWKIFIYVIKQNIFKVR